MKIKFIYLFITFIFCFLLTASYKFFNVLSATSELPLTTKFINSNQLYKKFKPNEPSIYLLKDPESGILISSQNNNFKYSRPYLLTITDKKYKNLLGSNKNLVIFFHIKNLSFENTLLRFGARGVARKFSQLVRIDSLTEKEYFLVLKMKGAKSLNKNLLVEISIEDLNYHLVLSKIIIEVL